MFLATHGILRSGGAEVIPLINTKSIELDGISDYCDTSSTYSELDGQTKATFSFWIKPTSASARYGNIFHIPRNTTNGNGQVYCFIDNSNRIRFSMDTVSYYIYSNTNVINLNQWNQILICVDLTATNEGVIFVNGIDETAINNISTRTQFSTSVNGLRIGDEFGNYLIPFLGNIDEFSIWSGTDLRNDVATIYNIGVPNDLNSNGLTAPTTWYRCGDNDTPTTIQDVNGSHDLTMQNFTTFSTDVP